jgi:hypothetical protein
MKHEYWTIKMGNELWIGCTIWEADGISIHHSYIAHTITCSPLCIDLRK